MTELALFLPSLDGGGAERVMVTLANGLAGRGFGVSMVLVTATGPYLGDVASGVEVVDLKAGRTLESLPGLVRYLRRARPASMLSALEAPNLMAMVARSMAHTTLRVTISQHAQLSEVIRRHRTVRERALQLLLRHAYRYADGVVAVSQGVAQDLVRCLGIDSSRIATVYNPVVHATMLRRAEERPAHPWLQGGGLPVVLAVGRLSPQKDFATLLRAFAQVRLRVGCRLIILGEGELREPLGALARALRIDEHVQFPGFVANPYAWMRRAHVFALSSSYEGFGLVLVEAMACGARVVSTDCPSGPREVLEEGKWGALVPVGDVSAMAEAVFRALVSPDAPDGRLRAADFGLDKALDAYQEVLGLRGCG